MNYSSYRTRFNRYVHGVLCSRRTKYQIGCNKEHNINNNNNENQLAWGKRETECSWCNCKIFYCLAFQFIFRPFTTFFSSLSRLFHTMVPHSTAIQITMSSSSFIHRDSCYYLIVFYNRYTRWCIVRKWCSLFGAAFQAHIIKLIFLEYIWDSCKCKRIRLNCSVHGRFLFYSGLKLIFRCSMPKLDCIPLHMYKHGCALQFDSYQCCVLNSDFHF